MRFGTARFGILRDSDGLCPDLAVFYRYIPVGVAVCCSIGEGKFEYSDVFESIIYCREKQAVWLHHTDINSKLFFEILLKNHNR